MHLFSLFLKILEDGRALLLIVLVCSAVWGECSKPCDPGDDIRSRRFNRIFSPSSSLPSPSYFTTFRPSPSFSLTPVSVFISFPLFLVF